MQRWFSITTMMKVRTYRDTLAKKMRREAEGRNLSALARKIGIPYTSAWRFVNESGSGTIKTLERIERYYKPNN